MKVRKVNFEPVTCLKGTDGGGRDKALHFFNSALGGVSKTLSGRLNLRKEPRYQLHRRLCAPERLGTISTSQGFELQTAHPLSSRQYQLHCLDILWCKGLNLLRREMTYNYNLSQKLKIYRTKHCLLFSGCIYFFFTVSCISLTLKVIYS